MSAAGRSIRAGVLASAAFVSSCFGGGSVDLHFVWKDAPPEPGPDLFVHWVVESDARVLTARADPYVSSDIAAEIDVPRGADRVLKVEIRDGIDRARSFAGHRAVSRPFTVGEGDVRAAIDLEMERVPSIAAVEILDTSTSAVRSSTVTFRVGTSGPAVELVVARDPSFDSGRRRFTIDPASTVHTISYVVDLACVDRCPGDEVSIAFAAIDRAGYPSRTVSRTLTIDRRAPEVLPDSVTITYAARALGLLPDLPLGALGPNVAAELTVAFDEPLAEAPSIASDPPVALSVPVSIGGAWRVRLEPLDDRSEGPITLEARVRDLAGNVATVPIVVPNGLEVDRTPPPFPHSIAYVRAPFGDLEANAPFFALRAPPGGVEPLATVIALDREALHGGIELGRTRASADGALDDLVLSLADRERVYAVVFDAAGNASDVRLQRNFEWIGSFGSGGSDPHTLAAVASLGTAREPDPERLRPVAADDRERAARIDGEVVSLRGERQRWVEKLVYPRVPSARIGSALAYDPARAKLVLFGGLQDDGESAGDLWEFDGAGWRDVSVASYPPPRTFASAVFDSVHERVLVLGGWVTGLERDANVRLDAWEWKDGVWSELSAGPNPPAGRMVFGAAYDRERGTTLIFGGIPLPGARSLEVFGDTVVYGPKGFEMLAPSHRPSPRGGHAMAYDEARRRVVLFGGCVRRNDTACLERSNETWEWDGTDWFEMRPPTSPSPRSGAVMTYDGARREIVLHGGRDPEPLTDTWVWDGVRWTKRHPIAHPTATRDFTIAYDAARSRVVLFGGDDVLDHTFDETWLWDGTEWRRHDPPVLAPSSRTAAAIGVDSARERVVLFGGNDWGDAVDGSIFEWDGGRWYRTPPVEPGPASRSGAAMAEAPGGAGVVLFGGGDLQTGFDDTWSWDGVAWTRTATAGALPSARRTSMVLDRARDRIVLFGGLTEDGSTRGLGDTWEFDGRRWSEVAVPGPARRYGHALAYDPARRRVVLFGGWNDEVDQIATDTWEFDGTAWYRITTADAPPHPMWSGLEYDALGGGIVALGGLYPDRFLPGNAPFWRYDGSSWLGVEAPMFDRACVAVARSRHDGEAAILAFGGSDFLLLRSLDETWQLEAEKDPRPAVLARFSLPFGPRAAVSRVELTARAGTVGSSGVEVLAWDAVAGAWVTLAASDSSEVSTIVAGPRAGREERLVSADREAVFALRPRDVALDATPPELILDGISISVAYSTPE